MNSLVFCQLRLAAERAGPPSNRLDQFSLPTDPPFRPATRLGDSLWHRAWRQNRLPLLKISSGRSRATPAGCIEERAPGAEALPAEPRGRRGRGRYHGVDRDRPGRSIRLPAVAGEDGSVSGLLGGRRDRPVRAPIYRDISHAASCRSGGSGGGSLLIATTIASRYSP
jgi:hypothetical protein